MGNKKAKLERSTPVLATADYPSARAFYRDMLGYQVVEEGGDPAQFGIFQRDGSLLFVDGWHSARPATPQTWTVYVHVKDLDALAAEFAANGVHITRPIEVTGYGMREFEITGPDGVVLCFGEDVPADQQD